MNIFSEIDRLITEHASAAVLRERVALVKEQNDSLQKKVAELEMEVTALKIKNTELEDKLTSGQESYKMKWGCLIFEGDENLYCPGCYLDRGKKIPTSRFNIHKRFCSACKTRIPSG